MRRRHLIASLGLVAAFATVSVHGDEAVTSTVENLFAHKTELSGKSVTVKGKVVKVNNNIMQRNWLHVQDGTGAEGTNDITVTSKQTANVGDEVTIRGQLVTDRDIGAGYNYALLIEEATVEVAAKK